MALRMTEREFQETVIGIFQARASLVFHFHDSRREIRRRDGTRAMIGDARAKGYPDLTIVRTIPSPYQVEEWEQVIWAELKSEKKNPDRDQARVLDALPAHRAYLWRPQDLETIDLISQWGHPQDGRTCWTCERETLIRRGGSRTGRKQ